MDSQDGMPERGGAGSRGAAARDGIVAAFGPGSIISRGRLALHGATAIAGIVGALGPQSMPGPLATLAGLWLLFGAPITLWFGLARRVTSGFDGALLVAVGFALVTDFVVLLTVNFAGPLIGFDNPLATVPLAAGFAIANIVIGVYSPAAEPLDQSRRRAGPPAGLVPVGAVGAVCVVLAIAGATRLDNGFGPAVSMVAYVAVAGLLVLMIMRQDRYPVGVVELGIFAAGVALLLLTSLRGWLVTGHDIQNEYEVYRLNLGGGRWEIGTYATAYNACLSITLLPVALTKLTAVSGIGVWKIIFPVLFALAPVALFRAAHNVAPRQIALLSAAMFLVFPTFFTDMPYMARQEVAFVLLGAALVVITDHRVAVRTRRAALVPLIAGIVLAHYATAYVLVLVLGAGFAVTGGWRLHDRITGKPKAATAAPLLAGWLVVVTAAFALGWAGPVTHTGGQLSSTLTTSLKELTGRTSDIGSSDTADSLVGASTITDAQRMAAYRTETLASTAARRARGGLLPESVLDKYPTPITTIPDLPTTGVGSALRSAGVSASGLNGTLRFGIATAVQLLLLVGLAVAFLSRVRQRGQRLLTPNRDQTALAVASIGVLVLLTVVPQLSVDYGVLRAFQQGIFFFGPFMAAGLMWSAGWFGRAKTGVTAAFLAFVLIDLTGVVPQLIGGYQPQLALDNSGSYYDLYYPTPPELNAANWLQARYDAMTPAAQQSMMLQASLGTYYRIQSVYVGPAEGSIYPESLEPGSYVLLGHSAVVDDRETVDYRGTTLEYAYPVRLLDDVKNKIYVSAGVEIYR